MRKADVLECELAAGASPLMALQMGLLESEPFAMTAEIKLTPECMFGVAPTLVEGRGSIWFLGTDRCVQRKGLDLTRAAKVWLPRLAIGWEELGNFVHANNRVHIRWLEALGFECVQEIPDFGPERAPFKEFVISCASLP